MSDAATYERDFYGWAVEQARAVREAGKARLSTPLAVDWENIAEELDGLARSEARELRSRYTTLLLHLLKWQNQPKKRARSWQDTIGRERDEIPLHLRDNPSLQPKRREFLDLAYGLARLGAARQTGLHLATFPETCPFTLEQVMDPEFWPE
jgi:hypothetical protein